MDPRRWTHSFGWLALAALAVPGAGALGQDVEARAYLSAGQVAVGRQFVLNVEVTGTQRLDSDPVLPAMDAFARFLGSGTSTSMQMVNGQTSVAITVQYRFQALQEGSYEIGPVEVTAGGTSLRTSPLTLVVSDTPPPDAGGQGGTDEVVSPEDLFVETQVSKRTAYENEPVLVEYRIFTRVNVESYTITSLPTATGFWTEELEQSASPQVEQVVRNGQQYASAVVRRVALFPTGVGEKTLDRLSLEAQVRVRRRRGFDPFGDIFDRSSLLGTRVPVVVTSSPVTLEVLPLPAEGRPPSFSGHVGTLDVSTSIDRPSVDANEAVTFRVEITGTGNLRSLPPPSIDFPVELEVFPPEVQDEISEGGGSLRGTRSFEYVLIPRVAGTVALPPVEVSFFDAGTGTYRSARTPAVELTVTGAPGVDGPEGTLPSAVEPIREEIRFIHIGATRFSRIDRPVFGSPWFWLVVLAPMFAVAGALGLRRHRDRIEGDVAYARVRRASRLAKRRLGKARKLASGDPREFYAEVAGALQGFLADKLNVAEAGLVRDEIRQRARERGASDDTLDQVFACLDDCDRQRFAPVGSQREPAKDVLSRAAALMGRLAKELAS